MPITTICLHAFREDEEGNCTYCDESEGPSGWCVYNRDDAENEGGASLPFDVSDERDFDDYASAKAEALARVNRLGARLFEY